MEMARNFCSHTGFNACILVLVVYRSFASVALVHTENRILVPQPGQFELSHALACRVVSGGDGDREGGTLVRPDTATRYGRLDLSLINHMRVSKLEGE